MTKVTFPLVLDNEIIGSINIDIEAAHVVRPGTGILFEGQTLEVVRDIFIDETETFGFEVRKPLKSASSGKLSL